VKKFALVTALIVVFTVHAQDGPWQPITPSPDLNGWTVVSGEWTVEEGVLIGKSAADAPAILLSDATYIDFDCKYEFLTVGRDTGGVYFRGHQLPALPIPDGVDPKTAPRALYGYRLGIDSTDAVTAINLSDPNGRGSIVAARFAGTETVRVNDWNECTVSMVVNDITVTINDKSAVTGSDTGYTKGRIVFEAAPGAEARFRNIRIQDQGRSGDWRALFNGENFDGWIEWGEEEWSVEDGIIAGRSGPKQSEGYLATEDTWKDFHVRGVFKMLGDGNYGLFYHSTIAYNDEQYPVISGLQGEVAPGYPSPSGWVYESYKRGWLVQPDMTQLGAFALDPDDWSEIEIKSQGNRIMTWVNGVRVLDHIDPTPNLIEGAFALQLHTGGAAGILWKDVYVKQ
jgi:hypothetical protein